MSSEDKSSDLSAEEAKDLLSEYADGELSREQQADLERILTDNPDLAYESTQIRNLKALLRQYQGEQPQSRFQSELMNKVEPETAAMPLRWRPLVWVLAAVLAAAVVLWYLISR